MYALISSLGLVIFLAIVVLPVNPTTAIFWIGGIVLMVIGCYSSKNVKIMVAIPFILSMMFGTILIFFK